MKNDDLLSSLEKDAELVGDEAAPCREPEDVRQGDASSPPASGRVDREEGGGAEGGSESGVAPSPGDALYVPIQDRSRAIAAGAVMREGDARLFVPRPIPPKVDPLMYAQWTTTAAKLRWMEDMFRYAFGADGDILDFLDVGMGDDEMVGKGKSNEIILHVPRSDSEKARKLKGVFWRRSRKSYVATKDADFSRIFYYLTEEARHKCLMEKRMDMMIRGLVRHEVINSAPSSDQGESIVSEKKRGKGFFWLFR